MSLLIPDNNVLLQFVPNVLKSVQGETLLFDKIAPHLEVAEAWPVSYTHLTLPTNREV